MQVVNKELAEQLISRMRAAGIEVPESSHYYSLYEISDITDESDDDIYFFIKVVPKEAITNIKLLHLKNQQHIPTFTLDEMLFNVLPKDIMKEDTFFPIYNWYLNKEAIYYDCTHGRLKTLYIDDKTNACDACAKLGIWLIDNGYWGV